MKKIVFSTRSLRALVPFLYFFALLFLILVGFTKVNASSSTIYGSVGVMIDGTDLSGSAINLYSSQGDLVYHTTVTNDNRSFELTGVSDNDNYQLEILPPADNPENLLPYYATIDVLGDVYLYGMGVLYNAETKPANIQIQGKILYDGMPADDSFQHAWIYMSPSTQFEQSAKALNPAISTGEFLPVSMPRGRNFIVATNTSFSYTANTKVISQMQPIYLDHDAVLNFNFDSSYNASGYAVRISDQCGNPLQGVQIQGRGSFNLKARTNTTANLNYTKYFYDETGDNGVYTIKTQPNGFMLKMYYVFDPSTGASVQKEISYTPTTATTNIVLDLPECLPSGDVTTPTLSAPVWSQNPKSINSYTSLAAQASDSSSEITRAEYFLGDTDPGQGNGATMNLTNVQNDGKTADATVTFGTDFPTGVYKVSVRAQDSAGNWSEPISDYLVVYNPNGPKMTGKRTIVPTLAAGDVLPGLADQSQTDKAKFGFSIKYNNQGQVAGNSDFQLSYSTGTKCNKPQQAVNCHELELNATSIAWLTTEGVNDSTGIFQGIARLEVDGVITNNVPFRVTGVDGERMSPTANDRFQVLIYNVGDNPNIATPTYRINAGDIARGNIKITN